MSEKKRSNKKNDFRKIKCRQCEFYDRDSDYCTERDIENCSRQNNVNFSKCDNFLVKDKLIYF
jgi:hypothetical protein